MTGVAEQNLILRFYDGAAWVSMLSGGGALPVKNTANNLDGSVSGGRFTVLFNNTSVPKITELGGTFIAMAVNRVPVANADTATVAEDAVLTVAAPGELANDADQDSDPLDAVLVSGTSHGQLVLQPNGAFTYTPQPNYHGPDSFTYTANDSVVDSIVVTVSITVTPVNDPPVAKSKNVTVPAGANCSAIASIDNGSFDIDAGDTITLTQTPPGPYPVGVTQVTLTVTDSMGAAVSSSAAVTVVDNTPPVALAQNITVQLDAAGQVTITAAQVNNGSSDNCGIQTMTLNVTAFTCANVGANTVKLTVTDVHGNSASATAIVTVLDAIAPVVLTKNITVPLDASGHATITVAEIDNGSSDSCGIASRTLSKTSFTCADLGPNTITLTVTDVNGKTASATAVVTVTDVTQPSLVRNGPAEIILLQGNTYNELGATAVDQCDTTVPVVIGGDPVNTAVIGVYVVTYDAADDSGNAAPRVTWTVRVLPPFSIGNLVVGFKEVDLDEASKVTGDILSQEKLTHGNKTLVTGFARNVTGQAELKESAQVNGSLETGGSVTLNESTTVGSNVISGGNVELKNKAKVVGNVTASGKVTVQRGATVGGTLTEKAPKPTFQNVLLPDLGLVSARPDIEVAKDKSLSLVPGTYGKLELKQSATVELTAGTYNFEQIDAAGAHDKILRRTVSVFFLWS